MQSIELPRESLTLAARGAFSGERDVKARLDRPFAPSYMLRAALMKLSAEKQIRPEEPLVRIEPRDPERQFVTDNRLSPFRRDGSEKRSVSEFPGVGQNPPSPVDPLERLYYLHDGMGVIGPITGLKLKEMIESGAVGRGSSVNVVGAPNWTPIMEFAPFPGFFRSGEIGPDYGAPPPAAAPGPEKFASFWIRLGAHVIDNVLTLLLLTAVALIFSIVIVAIHGDGAEEWARANANIVGVFEFVPIIAYYAYFSGGPWQATPGKRICGIYVIRTNGARLDAAFGALRYLTYFLSALPLGLGFLMPLWTKERKALHDIICGTRVVYGRL